MVRRVVIAVTYGSPSKSIVLNAVMVAVSDLVKEGIEPYIIQVYNPGSETYISVNGRRIEEIDEKLHERIKELVYETLIDEDLNGVRNYLLMGIAGALEEPIL